MCGSGRVRWLLVFVIVAAENIHKIIFKNAAKLTVLLLRWSPLNLGFQVLLPSSFKFDLLAHISAFKHGQLHIWPLATLLCFQILKRSSSHSKPTADFPKTYFFEELKKLQGHVYQAKMRLFFCKLSTYQTVVVQFNLLGM